MEPELVGSSSVGAVTPHLMPEPAPLSSGHATGTRAIVGNESIVNGIGLWKSWKRNFRTPVLALLDLFDNSMDATMPFDNQDAHTIRRGKVHVFGDTESGHMSGFCIQNNAQRRIDSLKNVLEVFRSGKGEKDIGENGVGTKQACAALSDLSWVMTKSGKRFGLGVIAFSLQRSDGVCLPSYEAEIERPDLKSLEKFLEELCAHDPVDLGSCVKLYGRGDIAQGRHRLVHHFGQMMTSEWINEKNVFKLVIHDGVHTSYHGDTRDEGGFGGPEKLMSTFAAELPRNYLHVPFEFDIRVQRKPIVFQYWERRLVELSHFPIVIDTRNSWKVADDWEYPENDTSYRVNLWIGFDPYRASQNGDNKASLLIYSRKSGRLIKDVKDGRAMLNVDCGGTSFAQGLTVILDDVLGRLPLTPTKQDLAFGHESTGDIHEANLFSWMSAFAFLYYHHWIDIYKYKSSLGSEVISHLAAVQANKTRRIDKTLLWGDFSTFKGLWFKKIMGANAKIRCKNRKNFLIYRGIDTLIKMNREPQIEMESSSKKIKKVAEAVKVAPAETRRKRRRIVEPSTQSDEEPEFTSSQNPETVPSSSSRSSPIDLVDGPDPPEGGDNNRGSEWNATIPQRKGRSRRGENGNGNGSKAVDSSTKTMKEDERHIAKSKIGQEMAQLQARFDALEKHSTQNETLLREKILQQEKQLMESNRERLALEAQASQLERLSAERSKQSQHISDAAQKIEKLESKLRDVQAEYKEEVSRLEAQIEKQLKEAASAAAAAAEEEAGIEAATTTASTIEQLQNEVAAHQAEIKTLKGKPQSATDEESQLRAQIATQGATIECLKQQAAEAALKHQEEREEKDREIEQLNLIVERVRKERKIVKDYARSLEQMKSGANAGRSTMSQP